MIGAGEGDGEFIPADCERLEGGKFAVGNGANALRSTTAQTLRNHLAHLEHIAGVEHVAGRAFLGWRRAAADAAASLTERVEVLAGVGAWASTSVARELYLNRHRADVAMEVARVRSEVNRYLRAGGRGGDEHGGPAPSIERTAHRPPS